MLAPERSFDENPVGLPFYQQNEEMGPTSLSADWKEQAHLKLRSASVSPEAEAETVRIDMGDDNSIIPINPGGNMLMRFWVICNNKINRR